MHAPAQNALYLFCTLRYVLCVESARPLFIVLCVRILSNGSGICTGSFFAPGPKSKKRKTSHSVIMYLTGIIAQDHGRVGPAVATESQ